MASASSARSLWSLSGKVALITGGAGGLGVAFAERLLQKGSKVCLVDYNKDAGAKAVAALSKEFGAGRAHFEACDVTSRSQLENVFKRSKEVFNREVDIVCNNAGIAPMLFEDTDKCVAINLTAVIWGTEIGYERMKNNTDGGVIINTASMAGILPVPFSPVYAATKAGVVNLSRSCGFMNKHRVRVNALCPSFTRTAMVTDNLSNDMFKMVVDSEGGAMEPSVVVDGFMDLVENLDHKVSVMTVTQRGTNFKSYADNPIAKL